MLLPSELTTEATTVTTSDWQIVQVNGETRLRKVRPGVLPSLSVGTDELAASAVTETKLGTGAVTETKLGTGAVTETKLGTSAVSLAKMANLSAYQPGSRRRSRITPLYRVRFQPIRRFERRFRPYHAGRHGHGGRHFHGHDSAHERYVYRCPWRIG